MDKKIVKFNDEIEEYKFYQNKIPVLTSNIDGNKIVVANISFLFNKISFVTKILKN